MSKDQQFALRWVAAAAVLVAAVFSVATARAAMVNGPFLGLEGAWSGGGEITLSNGTRERLRCRATYVVTGAGNSLQQAMRWAGDTYNFELRSDVRNQGSRLSGSWNELTRNLGGMLKGQAQKGRFEVSVNNPSFNANLELGPRTQ